MNYAVIRKQGEPGYVRVDGDGGYTVEPNPTLYDLDWAYEFVTAKKRERDGLGRYACALVFFREGKDDDIAERAADCMSVEDIMRPRAVGMSDLDGLEAMWNTLAACAQEVCYDELERRTGRRFAGPTLSVRVERGSDYGCLTLTMWGDDSTTATCSIGAKHLSKEAIITAVARLLKMTDNDEKIEKKKREKMR